MEREIKLPSLLVYIYRDNTVQEWVSWSPDIDVLSQGRTPEKAFHGIADAMALVINHAGENLGDVWQRKAPEYRWDRIWETMKRTPLDGDMLPHLDAVERLVELVVPIDLTVFVGKKFRDRGDGSKNYTYSAPKAIWAKITLDGGQPCGLVRRSCQTRSLPITPWIVRGRGSARERPSDRFSTGSRPAGLGPGSWASILSTTFDGTCLAILRWCGSRTCARRDGRSSRSTRPTRMT